ncbi:MAG: PBP1A family penicillin-binding protein [Actinomycetota bacterium]
MKVATRIALVIVLGFAIAIGGLIGWFYSGIGLPDLASLHEYKAAQNSKVFAADGTLLCELYGDQNREIISLQEMPESFRNAVIATEDRDFYGHRGVDWKGVIRALWANVVQGTVVEGGSTITQQYVKNAYVGPKRTLWRKIQEAHLAYQLEQKYSKNKILEMYLNDAYFGNGCYGVFTAARRYFGKTPAELTLAQSAMLTGVLAAPSYYDPYSRPQEVQEKRNNVLRKMHNAGYINRTEMDAALNTPMDVAPKNQVYVTRRAPYFCDYITALVRRKYGDQQAFRGGLRIYTTIDLRLQDLAENVIARSTEQGEGPDAAMVCIDPRTGYIKAMVGGKDYATSQFNVAADGHRQAGSSFKTFVLVRALADKVSPNQTYDASSPRTIQLPDGGVWKVSNYEGHGSGTTSVRNATIHSINVVFAQLIMDVGPSRVAEMAKQMGITSFVDPNPAIALGGLTVGVNPLEMASAYGTLANNGSHALPRSISKITDANGNLVDEGKPEVNQVIDPEVATEANSILQSVVSGGTGVGAQIGRPQAGKTGTAEDYADAWFVGYTPDLVTAVWVGYPQGRISMGHMTGGSLPASIWARFMGPALEDTPETAFVRGESGSDSTQSEDITVTVCDVSGMLAGPNCPTTHSRTFKRGEEPQGYCNVHTQQQTRTVPSVVGMSSSSALSALSSAGYSGTVVNQTSGEEAGTVISQTPAAGTTLAAGGSVTIYVSTGVPEGTVPGVVGMAEAAAKTRIAAAGFAASASYAPGGSAGTVIGQSPGAGAKMPLGSTVSITVASGSGGGGIKGMSVWWPL